APKRRLRSAFTPSGVRTSPRSALAAAAVIALVVGALGGFAFGRSSAPKHSAGQTASAPKPEANDATSPPSTALADSFGAGSAGGASVAGTGGTLTRLFDRTTSDGVSIHVFTTKTDSGTGAGSIVNCLGNTTCTDTLKPSGPITGPSCGSNDWCPPPECY